MRRHIAFAGLLLASLGLGLIGQSAASGQEPVNGLVSEDGQWIIEYLPGTSTNAKNTPALTEALDAASTRQAEAAAVAEAIVVDGITVNYDPANAPPAAAQVVIEQAVADWAAALDTSGGPIEILVSWNNLGNPNFLAAARATEDFRDPTGVLLTADFFSPAALANVLVGVDLQPDTPEIEIFISPTVNWYIATTGPPGTQVDLYTVMLHELAHGLGFSSRVAGTPPAFLLDPPTGYDTHIYHGDDPLQSLPNPASLLTSDNLFFDLPIGPRHKLHAPATWVQGSSYSHFDEATYTGDDPGTLMTPAIGPGEDSREIDAPVLGVMERIGWPLPNVKPGLRLLPQPCIIYDSTQASAPVDGPIAPGNTIRLQAVAGLPAGQGSPATLCTPLNVTAAVVTVSAIDPQGAGNLRLSPAGVVATGGVVNYTSNGLNNASTVTVPVSPEGQIDVFVNAAATDIRVSLVGYYAPGGPLRYNSLTPCASADTRSAQGAQGGFIGPFAAGTSVTVDVVGDFPAGQGGGNTTCGVPEGADGVVVNLVAVGPTGGQGFLSAASSGLDPSEPMTPFADINLNNATVAVLPLTDDNIRVDVEAVTGSPSTHIRVVVLGFLDSTGATFNPLNPCAAFDSRTGQGASGAFLGLRVAGPVGVTSYQMTGALPAAQGGGGNDCGVPADASAVLINVVGIQPNGFGNFRAYATGSSPSGGVLNWSPLNPAMNNSNAIVVPLSEAGQIDLFTNAPANTGTPTVHARGVILGYYE